MSHFADYPPALGDDEQEYLLSNLKDWAIANGLAVRPAPGYVPDDQNPSGALAATAPVTLFPSLFPRVCYEQAKSVAKAYNELYAAIASDEAWLKMIIEELIEIDEFIGGLWKIHLQVKAEEYVQPMTLGLFRSDYMVHTSQDSVSVKQVEFNTIAASFGGLSTRVSALHQHLESIGAYPDRAHSDISLSALSVSQSVPSLARGLAEAHAAYGTSSEGRPTCVLFIVQDPERNVFDQRHLQYELTAKHSVPVFRLPFDRVLQDTRISDNPSRKLLYAPPHAPKLQYEVSVVYFRAGYAPSEYNDASHWAGRLQIERSAAIKCPSVLTQLAGTKKVQQVLATPHSAHLSRFLPDAAQAEAVRATFAPQYPMDQSAAGREAAALATDPASAKRFVLKPQREGGGNNIYRAAIPDFLAKLPSASWPAYILMEMIEPPAQRNTIFRNGTLQSGGVICELGVYGACLWSAQDGEKVRVLENFEAGYLLRTKGDQSEEGGVAAGFGAVDSLCLV